MMEASLAGIVKKNQIAVNMITNILAMSFTMLISLWITPYLIQKLGIAAYGYIGLLNNITNFMAVITYTLTSMVARFLTVSMEKKGPQEASKYLSSAFFTNLILGALLIPIILLIEYYLGALLKIRNEYLADVKIAFVLGGISFVINSIYLVLSSGPYYKNRLDITNAITIFSNLLRVLFLVSMFSLFAAQIWHYAAASAIQVTIALILGIIVFRVLLPNVQMDIHLFRYSLSIELLTAGFFNATIILGTNFLTQIDLIVGNRYLPAEIVGMYAAILLIPNSIRNIASALSFAFSPTTVRLYSTGNMDELRNYTNRVVKICGLLIGWPIAIVSGLAIPILYLWLKRDYSSYQFTIILMLLPLTINLAVNQLFIVQQAMNKVKIPAFASILFGVMNVVIAIFFTAFLKMGILGIVLSGVITTTLRSSLFIPIYTAIITNQSKIAYYRGIISPLLVTVATCMAGILLQKSISLNSLFTILFTASALSILYLGISFLLLTAGERNAILAKIPLGIN